MLLTDHALEKMKRPTIYLIFLALSLLATGCVTVTPQTTASMSDQFICEMLGPMWISTAEEQRVMREELDRRGVICDYGRIVGYSQERSESPSKAEARGGSSGTGFFITSDGHLITNQHLIEECKKIEVGTTTGTLNALPVQSDPVNDLALLKVADDKPRTFATFRSGQEIRVGDDVIVAGFPLAGLLGDSLKATVGTVSSLTGLENDTRILQITAPVQPGNSGGPLIDRSGNVVGIVSAKLNEVALIRATGSLPQNVNFAIKASTVQAFLNVTDVRSSTKDSKVKLEAADIVDLARIYTVRVKCE